MKKIETNTLFCWIRPILFLVGCLFFVALVINSWHETSKIITHTNLLLFLTSVFLGVVDHFIISLMFQSVLQKYGISVPYRSVGRMYFYGQMSKYIPGRVWNVIYQRSFVGKSGTIGTLFFVNMELLAIFMARTLILSSVLILGGFRISFSFAMFAFGFILFSFLARSRLFLRGLYWAGKKLNRPMDEKQYNGYLPGRIFLLFLYLAATATFLSSNFLMMYAVFYYTIDVSYLYVAFLGVAWVIGVLSIIFPAGIGIREAIFVLLTSISGLDPSVEMLTAIAVVHRFWSILLDLCGLSIGYIASCLNMLKSRS